MRLALIYSMRHHASGTAYSLHSYSLMGHAVCRRTFKTETLAMKECEAWGAPCSQAVAGRSAAGSQDQGHHAPRPVHLPCLPLQKRRPLEWRSGNALRRPASRMHGCEPLFRARSSQPLYPDPEARLARIEHALSNYCVSGAQRLCFS